MKEIRDIIKRMEEHLLEGGGDTFSLGYDDATSLWKGALEAVLPPRTLQDMSFNELGECQWMQADHKELGLVLLVGFDGGVTECIDPDGELIKSYDRSEITPRFDLPKLNPWDPPSARSVKTKEEYEGLPDGSVVAADGEKPWVKKSDFFKCHNGSALGISAEHMSGIASVVLREGWRP